MREINEAWIHLGGVKRSYKNAVHAIPDLEAVLIRLDVNVAGSGLDGLGDDVIDQLDNRRIAGVIEEIGGIFDFTDDGTAIFFHILHQLFGRTLTKIIGEINGRDNFFAWR